VRRPIALGWLCVGLASCAGPAPGMFQFSCGQATPEPGEREPQLEEDLPCDNRPGILRVEPELGAEEIFTDEVLLILDGSPEWAELSLADADGSPIPGTSALDGRFVSFTSPTPFPPSTELTATFESACFDPVSWAFQTGWMGEPVEDLTELEGRMLRLHPQAGHIDAPELVGALLRNTLEESGLIFSVSTAGEAEAELMVGAALWDAEAGEYVQDLCVATHTWPPETPGAFDNPHLTVETTTATLPLMGVAAPLTSLRFTTWFSPDGHAFDRGALSAMLDTRELGAMVGSASAGAVCEELLRLESECVPCEDGEYFCMPLELEGLRASDEEVAGDPFIPRAADDIAADPDCP